MRFPTYPPEKYGRPPISVLEGYIDFYGRHERDNRELIERMPKTSVRGVAMRVGRGCWIACTGNAPAATKMFRRAQRDLDPLLDTPEKRRQPTGRVAAELRSTAHLLEHIDCEQNAGTTRRTAHERTINDIRRIRARLVRTDEHAPRSGLFASSTGSYRTR